MYGRYNLAMFTHAMDFFKECVSFKKLIPKPFFTSLLNNLSIEDLLTLGEFAIHKIHESSMKILCSSM
jgi:hypothetical protein